jgi:hypothetical protein
MIQHHPESRAGGHFDWPEPLVIDLIHERYCDRLESSDSIRLAKLQERTLRALFDGAPLRFSALRLELTVSCAARGIDLETIAKADRAVFWELTRLVGTRFRTSPRTRVAIAEELYAALGSIATEAKPPVASRTVRQAPARRLH